MTEDYGKMTEDYTKMPENYGKMMGSGAVKTVKTIL